MSGLLSSLKWLYPGMRVKRWIGLAATGVALALLGAAALNHAQPVDGLGLPNGLLRWSASRLNLRLYEGSTSMWFGGSALIAGLAVLVVGVGRLSASLTTAWSPGTSPGSLVDAVYRNRLLTQGHRVVVIGGGTGLSTMLRGLKQYTSNIVAIVTVTDDGGSSGKLQKQLNILPPGDIRNCLVALADSEATMTELFQFRFRSDRASEGLRDHSFGNLLIAAMSEISGGDFEEAVRQTSKVLNIRGRVLPSTKTQICLRAEMEDGSTIEGESSIVESPLRIKYISLSPAEACALPEALEAIRLADIIILGPGSVFTSVIPNLLVRGIPEALHSSRAKKAYICNVMTQPGETDGFTASQHVRAIEAHVKQRVFDYVLVNSTMPSLELQNRYRQTGAVFVEPDCDRIRAMGYRAVAGAYVGQTDSAKHDPGLLAEAIVRMMI